MKHKYVNKNFDDIMDEVKKYMVKPENLDLIKLVDRLHNMLTLQYMPEEKQMRIAAETLEVYAPIAHRLGISEIKNELEDLSFMYLNREKYFEIAHLVEKKKAERDGQVSKMIEEISQLLNEHHIPHQIKGRAKCIYSIYNKLKNINIDGIIDSSYIKSYLENRSLFPTVMLTERPDKASQALLEGKVIILCDLSPYAIILPSFFIDFFHTADDYYQKKSNTSFIRIIRLISFLIAIFLPGIYIAVTTRNYDLVPFPLLMILKAGRTFVPFPAYIEALFMIICFEILKESDLRMSSTTGSAVSILGGLILGDAAVSAGIVSPIMIIIIAISSIAALIFPTVELVNAIRFYKILLLFLAALFGIYGVFLGTVYLLYHLFSMKSFNFSYLAPFYPFKLKELSDSFILKDNKVMQRNSYLTDNAVRGRK